MAASRTATMNLLKELCGNRLKVKDNDVSLDLGKGKFITGATTIAKHLLRTSEDFKGLSLEERLIVEQWLEMSPPIYSLEVGGDREKIHQVLQDLNVYLEDKVYIAAAHITMADIVLFHSLHPVFAKMTFQEKENIINVSRWFNHIQQNDKALQSLIPLIFLRTMLYDGTGHH